MSYERDYGNVAAFIVVFGFFATIIFAAYGLYILLTSLFLSISVYGGLGREFEKSYGGLGREFETIRITTNVKERGERY